MKYTSNDYNFIENWIYKCVKIEIYNRIYYISNDNIVRQLKYNNILKTNKKIKIDFNVNFNDNVILEQDLTFKRFYINYNLLSMFKSKSKYNYQQSLKIINNILCDILNLNNYRIVELDNQPWLKLHDIFKPNKYTIIN